MFVFLNGQIIKEEEAKISISDLSYQFGYGLFETIKCEQGTPVFFESHYKRLTHSAKELDMPFPVEQEEIKKWIRDVLSANKLTSGRVKIIISKRLEGKFNVFIMASPLDQLPSSYSLMAYTLSRDTKSISFRHKTTSRADSYIAYKKAQGEGFNDALYINEKNELIECTRANIFLVLEDRIITPLLESGILSGVTRSKIIEITKRENITIEEKNVHSLYLNKTTAVFITSAIVGLMPISKVKFEDKEYSFPVDSKILSLRNEYDGEVQEYLRSSKSLISS